ncbi:hypothetical protein V5E97_10225 [Singulisphaera sp. Ch08]|uniref:Uncharacterized protein n=1 Tax=Singulisphaera sp. Ch08 TaxID=3120278 RepID=A0AAU7CMR4_9BACT
MPPTDKARPTNPASKGPPGPNSIAPCLPPHRAGAIGQMTAKARELHAELRENAAKADQIAFRQAAIRRELAEIDKQVREHAWDGQPLS